jgi:hypothetical protein
MDAKKTPAIVPPKSEAHNKVCFAPDLVVYAHDHRRLYRGPLRKTLHSITRCLLLYLGLISESWLSHDWGYWSYLDEEETVLF